MQITVIKCETNKENSASEKLKYTLQKQKSLLTGWYKNVLMFVYEFWFQV